MFIFCWIWTFSRFLEVASFSQGSLINVSEVARDAHIQRTVAESYFSIVEDLLIGIRLPVFSRPPKRGLVALPFRISSACEDQAEV